MVESKSEMKHIIEMIDIHFPKFFDSFRETNDNYSIKDIYNELKYMEYTEKGIELFRLCGCGIPEKVTELYHNALKSLNSQNSYSESKFCDNEILEAVILYNLDNLGMTEHTTSIYVSRLTKKGETALRILEERE